MRYVGFLASPTQRRRGSLGGRSRTSCGWRGGERSGAREEGEKGDEACFPVLPPLGFYRSPKHGGIYIFAIIRNVTDPKTILRMVMAPTDLALLFETSFTIDIFVDVAP
jgi:hypothetical protein